MGLKNFNPTADAINATIATAVSAIPAALFPASPAVLIPILSSVLWGLIGAQAARSLNERLLQIEDELRAVGRTFEDAASDSILAAAISRIVESAARQDGESKRERIHNFIRHHIRAAASAGDLVKEAVLQAFAKLPASHIEEFLRLIDPDPEAAAEWASSEGDIDFNLESIAVKEHPEDERDSCASPVMWRIRELETVFDSLAAAGLVRIGRTFRNGSVDWSTTSLAKSFVAYCTPPSESPLP